MTLVTKEPGASVSGALLALHSSFHCNLSAPTLCPKSSTIRGFCCKRCDVRPLRRDWQLERSLNLPLHIAPKTPPSGEKEQHTYMSFGGGSKGLSGSDSHQTAAGAPPEGVAQRPVEEQQSYIPPSAHLHPQHLHAGGAINAGRLAKFTASLLLT